MNKYNCNGAQIYTSTENDVLSEDVKINNLGDIVEISLKIVFKDEIVPQKYTVGFFEPLVGVYGMWDCLNKYQKDIRADWCRRSSYSRSACGAPIVVLYDSVGNNKLAISVSDASNMVVISAGVIEEDGTMKCEIEFFTELTEKMKEYSAVIRLDRRPVPFYKAVTTARDWWQTLGYTERLTPPAAFEPIYSTWYVNHQDLIADSVLEECKLAKRLGMHGVIVDDGWQTDQQTKGYYRCGDFEISRNKFPDMKRFVETLHSYGMKMLLWYPVPYVGFEAKNFHRFEGMYLYKDKNQGAGVLDPRFAVVRQYIVSHYAEVVQKYGYDGLKLDFIDSFRLTEESSTDYEKMDCKSLEEGVQRLLSEITAALSRINPEILIEFRQGYIGPVMTSYGNIVRVSDCPNDFNSNRIGITDLRLITKSVAVHSDMLMWNVNETAEGVALQLLNTLFAVPQISVKLKDLPADHLAVLKNYLSVKEQLAEIIYGGELSCSAPVDNYSWVTAQNGGRSVTAVYSPTTVAEIKGSMHWLFNAAAGDSVIVTTNALYTVTVFDSLGAVVDKQEQVDGIARIAIPSGGMAVFIRL